MTATATRAAAPATMMTAAAYDRRVVALERRIATARASYMRWEEAAHRAATPAARHSAGKASDAAWFRIMDAKRELEWRVKNPLFSTFFACACVFYESFK